MVEGLVPYSDNDSAATSSNDEDDERVAAEPKPGGAAQDAGHTAAPAEHRSAKRARSAGGAAVANLADTRAPSRKLQTLRNFPHQEGNFATTVFLPVRLSDAQHAALQDVYNQLRKQAPTLQVAAWTGAATSAQEVPAEHHISVSRTVALRYAQVDEVIGSLQHNLRKLAKFDASFGGLKVLENDNASRIFVCLMMNDGKAHTCNVVRAVDKTLRTNCLRTFHEDPKPHVSLAWDFPEHRIEVEAAVASCNEGSASARDRPVLAAKVDIVCCQVGQKQYTVWPAP